MGYTGSWMAEWFSIGVHPTLILVVTSNVCIATCILCIFTYRVYMILPFNHFLRFNGKGHIYASVAYFVIYVPAILSSMWNSSPDQNAAKQWVLTEYSCALSVMNVPRLHIYTPESVRQFLISSIVLIILGAPLMIVIIWSYYHYLNQKGNLSEKTRNMQRRFLYYVYIQASIPGVCLFLPLFIIILTMITSEMKAQGIGNIAMGAIALHGLVSSITMILCNEPYRRYTLNLSKRSTLPK
ncbi:unnamed protein product [Cylicocyclus nassatus]|uniref:Uncharacterized protein n=1 Tax=Cylicocyclus nassatus TaxID=53992 RepID=A0AA36GKI1_CYLNA|nr:unnamed protein product [Cylicocyclus nassatus]